MATATPTSWMSGDLEPDMTIQLTGTAVIAQLPAALSVALLWKRPDGTAATVSCTVVDPVKGIVKRSWAAGDTAEVGQHQGTVQVTCSNGEIASDPADGSYLTWQVFPALSGPASVPPPPVVGAGSPVTALATCSDAGGCGAGAPVRISGSGTFARAEANASGTARVVGIATQAFSNGLTGLVATSGPVTLLTTQWDAIVSGEVGGLTPGATYYLSDASPGFLVTPAPSTVGHFVVEVGVAFSTTTLVVDPKTPIPL